MELLRCLVVDDDEVGREILILNLQGIARCDSAANGREALEKYSANLDTNPYDLIFLDIIMPELDGNETAKTIRRMELERGITPDKGVSIIVFSSLNTPQDIIKTYISAQSAAHLVKPLNVEKLKKTLFKLGLIPEEVTVTCPE
jgi:two-component system chemotaxis response regulator CheY